MDEAGWHARKRAYQERQQYLNPQKDAQGRFKAVEDVQPLNAPWTKDITSNDSSQEPTPPPPLPPKDALDDNVYKARGPPRPTLAYRPPGASAPKVPGQSPLSDGVQNLSPVERTARSVAPPRMRPYLQCMCGPLLKYDTVDEDGIYHGACLLVTADAGSKYDPLPCMTLEWDPSATSATEPEVNLHRRTESQAQHVPLSPHPSNPHSILNGGLYINGKALADGSAIQQQKISGEELWVYPGIGGTFTFWRFTYQIPLSENEIRVHYSINSGQKLSFFIPGRNQNMNFAVHSCNGFSAGVNEDEFRGPGFDSGYDPLWVDLLQRHKERPFHVLVGGGDQLYCDKMMREPELQEWVKVKTAGGRIGFQLTDEMILAIDRFYFSHYCNAFRHGAFARANSSIPMLNMLDDHDLIDGYGSYPEDLQNSQMFRQIGARGYFYFLLFQCFINDEKDGIHAKASYSSMVRSLVVGGQGSYIPFPSHSFVTYLGPKVWMLLLDCRAERRKNQVCSEEEYTRVFERLKTVPDGVEHLVVQIGIPIAYPRLNFLEHALESKYNPLTAISKTGTMAKNFVNKFNSDAELLDDLNDHWTATPHKKERNWFVEQLQHFALQKRLRISFISGDVHCAAVGLFKTLSKGKGADVAPGNDHRYMLNVVSSAIVNTPPPAGVLTMVSFLAPRKHRTMHSLSTDETMLPLFAKDTNGTASKTKYVMGRRNYCTVERDPTSGELLFDIRVEIEKGKGQTTGYPVRTPPPLWQSTTGRSAS